MLSEVLRTGRESTAGLSPLSTPDSILMCYPKLLGHMFLRGHVPLRSWLSRCIGEILYAGVTCSRKRGAHPGLLFSLIIRKAVTRHLSQLRE